MIIYTCPECGKDLKGILFTTYPPTNVYRCLCGWNHEERENVRRIPFPQIYDGTQTTENQVVK